MFDPNKPANNSDLDAGEVRNNFNALYLMAMPIGSIVAWCKNQPGVPPLSEHFVECNGQVLNDPASPLDGQTIHDLNGTGRFLRGAGTSGTTGGNETHSHGFQSSDTASAGSDVAFAANQFPGTTEEPNLPPYYEVVWVMRVK